jgi:hypothetical protein
VQSLPGHPVDLKSLIPDAKLLPLNYEHQHHSQEICIYDEKITVALKQDNMECKKTETQTIQGRKYSELNDTKSHSKELGQNANQRQENVECSSQHLHTIRYMGNN